jgi:hypothetical protein
VRELLSPAASFMRLVSPRRAQGEKRGRKSVTHRVLTCVLIVLALVPTAAYGQDAALSGTVIDDSMLVLPGVTITATERSTGRQYLSVSDERGEYRMPSVAPGSYRLQAELPGFSTAVVPAVDLLVGQKAVIPFNLKVSGVVENVTVSSQAPLVDLSSSVVGGNVDRKRMADLPLQGRNWMELSMMVKGITANNVDNQPGVSVDTRFQLNLDGQQITQRTAGSGFGQPKFSRESIAEFQIITNLFDVTQGRSTGIQVQAISRSGTNVPAGSFYGSFRDSKFSAPDHVAGRVLPFENQQVGASFGGPLVKDRAHYFVSYEYERQPQTIFTQPARLAGQSFSNPSTVRNNSVLGRYDQVVSTNSNLSLRGSFWDFKDPFNVLSTGHPSNASLQTKRAYSVIGNLTRVISTNTFSELRAGFNHFDWSNQLAVPQLANTPNYVFSGLIMGGPRNFPQWFRQNQLSARYDLTLHRGAHDFKIGGEYIGWRDTGEWRLLSRGEFTFASNPPDLNARFPAEAWNDPAAWNVSGLDARAIRFDQNYGDWTIDIPRPTWGVWFGDTWRTHDRLTLNYGVRWDVDWGAMAPPGGEGLHIQWTPAPEWSLPLPIALSPGDELFKNDIRNLGDVAPRAGFNWNVTEKNDFAIRGGTGLYYGTIVSNDTFSQQSFNAQRILVNSYPNDNQPGFLADPTRGVTIDDIVAGRVPLPAQSPRVISPDMKMPMAWQSSIGFQKQVGALMGFDMDLTHTHEYRGRTNRDPNLFYDPVTGYNRPVSSRPDPKFTSIQWMESKGETRRMALASSFSRRLQHNFQGGMTYTYMFYDESNTDTNNPFFTFDLPFARTIDFQRHTLRFNGIYRLPWQMQLSAVYFYGSGNPVVTSVGGANPFGKTGTNRLNIGAPIVISESLASRWTGPMTIGTNELVGRNALMGLPLHKVDVRLSQEVVIGRSFRITATAEVFNLFDHANYGTYIGSADLATLGRPLQNLGNAYLARAAQFGFRVGF